MQRVAQSDQEVGDEARLVLVARGKIWWVMLLCAVSIAATCTLNKSRACTLSVSPASVTFGTNGGSTNLTLTVPGGCTWTATTFYDFITISNSVRDAFGNQVLSSNGRTLSLIVQPTFFGGNQNGAVNVTTANAGWTVAVMQTG